MVASGACGLLTTFQGRVLGNSSWGFWHDCIWVVVKILVLFWVLIIIRHLLFRVPKKGP